MGNLRKPPQTRINHWCTRAAALAALTLAPLALAQPFPSHMQSPIEYHNALDAALTTQPLQSPLSTTPYAPKQSTPEELERERFAYQAAKSALKKRQFVTAKAHLAALQNYPLKPYIEYGLIAAKAAQLPLEEIDQFLTAYPDSLLADKLTGNTLYFLAEQQRWQDFNRYYSTGFSSAAMQCRSMLARYHTGDMAALDEGVALWDTGRSQPKACDPLFSLLKQNKKLTADVLWSRFNKAITNNKLSLARFIQRSMTAEQQQNAELYLKVSARPALVTKRQLFSDSSPQIQDIIAYGIAKLARTEPQLAWKHWEQYEAQFLFDASTATATKRQIVKYLTRKGHLSEAEQLLSYSHSLRETSLIESLIRENLEQLNWHAVAANIPLLTEEEQKSDRWRYWTARSHEALGNKDVDSKAIYHELASSRSWYGFLAADHLDKGYQLEDASAPANSFLKSDLAYMPAMQRAKELWIIGEQQQARTEWYYALKTLDTAQLLAAGELAKDWGWYNSGIVAMITGNLWDHLTLRFPLAYTDEVAQAAATSQLDQTLIYAIARQESAFAADAVSHAGARGLMQLMPATAKQQARHSGVKNHRTQDLFTPEHNIKLGSAYLGKLLSEFNGNRILAAAAYNAGKHRVKKWLKTPQLETPTDVWVETIPFRETRHYVQNVMTYAVIYNYRMEMNTSEQNEKNHDIKGRLLRSNEAKIAL